MAQRWAMAALLRAEKKFRRVKGYKELPRLAAVLQQKSLDRRGAQLRMMQRGSSYFNERKGRSPIHIPRRKQKVRLPLSALNDLCE
jgi:hypothetical protein